MIELLLAPFLLSAPLPANVPTLYIATADDMEVERTAREYRIQVYETFRADRLEYDRRRDAGDQILHAYRETDRRSSHHETVLRWFAAASEVSRLGALEPLPEIPDFAASFVASANNMAALPPVPLAVVAKGSGAEVNVKGPTAATPVAKATAAQTPRPAPPTLLRRLGDALLRGAVDTYAPGPAAHMPEPGPDAVALDAAIPMQTDDEPTFTQYTETTDDEPAEEEPAGAGPAVEPARMNPATRSTPDAVAETGSPASDRDRRPASDSGLDELDASVAQFNRSLEGFQDRLGEEETPRPFHIARWLNELTELSSQRQTIVDRLQGLPQAERESAARPLPIEPARQLLKTKVDEATTRLRQGGFSGSDEDRQSALELINVLNRQLSLPDNDR